MHRQDRDETNLHRDPTVALVAFNYNSRLLFKLAREALLRIEEDVPETEPGQHEALATVVFSTATLEAAIEELSLTARLASTAKSMPPYLQTLSVVLDLAENSHASVRLKYDLAMQIATGGTFDRKSQPYQDFNDLVKLRDNIVHLKPSPLSTAPTKLEERLRSRGICSQRRSKALQDWIECVSTKAVAKWAFGVPRRVGDAFIQSASEPSSHLFMKIVWGSGLDMEATRA